MLEEREGELAVRLARAVVEAFARGRPLPPLSLPPVFDGKGGVFVTLNLHPGGDLRGCIGFPSPLFPLRKAIVQAAEGAAEDPRFPRLDASELAGVVVEVSVLTAPEEIVVRRRKDMPSQVRVGTDGLAVARGANRGLLLPQVAVEWNWDAEEFLGQTCMKAGLPPDSWLEPETRVSRFQAAIWTEIEPRGPVVRRKLRAHARA